MIPSAMEIGKAGSALWYNTSKSNVKHNPIIHATEQVITVFQSYNAARPTNTL